MNPFSYKRFDFPKWYTPFCRDLTQVRCLTCMGSFSSYKQLLRKGVLRNFAKFTGKHLCKNLFFNKVAVNKLWHRCFPVNFAKFLRIPFLQNTLGECFWNSIKFCFANIELLVSNLGLNPQSYLCFQDFQGSKLLIICLVNWLHTVNAFLKFFRVSRCQYKGRFPFS